MAVNLLKLSRVSIWISVGACSCKSKVDLAKHVENPEHLVLGFAVELHEFLVPPVAEDNGTR